MKLADLFETDFIAQNARRNRQMASAQSQYDNMMPPEDEEYVECRQCQGTGQVPDENDENGEAMLPCPYCEGEGARLPDADDYRRMEQRNDEDRADMYSDDH